MIYTVRIKDGIEQLSEETLYKKISNIVWKRIHAKYKSCVFKPQQEDMASITIQECFNSLKHYKPTGDVYGYLKRVAWRQLGKEAKKIVSYCERYPTTSLEAVSLESEIAYPEEPPDEITAWIEGLKELLEPEELQVVELALEGLDNSEICQELRGVKLRGRAIAAIWERVRNKAELLGGDPRTITQKEDIESMVKLNKIRGLMAEHGDTQESLAAKLGVSKQLLNLKLTGKSCFSIEMLNTIAKLYNVSIDTLVD